MSCEKCIHGGVCSIREHWCDDAFASDCCECFINEDLIVEMPCAIGDSIYVLERTKRGTSYPGFVHETSFAGIHLTKRTDTWRRKEDYHYIVVRCNGFVTHLPMDKQNVKWFLSYEEAKKALYGS